MPTAQEIWEDNITLKALAELKSSGIYPYSDKTNQWNIYDSPLNNFQWVSMNSVARCAQPGYDGNGDQNHHFNDGELDFLEEQGITCIISLNHCNLSPGSRADLVTMNIRYEHIPTPDRQAISVANQATIVGHIQAAAGPTLLYCGYGQGRTGTAVAAWGVRQMLYKRMSFFVDFNWDILSMFVREGFGVEQDSQVIATGQYLRSLAPRPPPGRIKAGPIPARYVGLGPVPVAPPVVAPPVIVPPVVPPPPVVAPPLVLPVLTPGIAPGNAGAIAGLTAPPPNPFAADFWGGDSDPGAPTGGQTPMDVESDNGSDSASDFF